jgi:hypothetical protein
VARLGPFSDELDCVAQSWRVSLVFAFWGRNFGLGVFVSWSPLASRSLSFRCYWRWMHEAHEAA